MQADKTRLSMCDLRRMAFQIYRIIVNKVVRNCVLMLLPLVDLVIYNLTYVIYSSFKANNKSTFAISCPTGS